MRICGCWIKETLELRIYSTYIYTYVKSEGSKGKGFSGVENRVVHFNGKMGNGKKRHWGRVD